MLKTTLVTLSLALGTLTFAGIALAQDPLHGAWTCGECEACGNPIV
ncbi:MAG: hypothetical protein QOE90_3226 [Thermoplasmata archaeon]|jgi:hypothetical protein|nr:hypothetical protein [Thermoplasmata archaeon]